MKLNCWEFMKCGREPLGDSVDEMGICPAATEKRCDGVNNGKNAGRACWLVAGTMCGGKVQGIFASKLPSCMECEFFKRVRAEEKASFQRGADILPRICNPLELVRAYEQLNRAYKELKETQAQLLQAQKVQAVGKVAAGVAHELNNPLTGILVYAEELLECAEPDDPKSEDYRFIIHETLRCRQIVRDLLDFSRQAKSDHRLTFLEPVIIRALDLVKRQHSFHDIRFNLDIRESEFLVKVDPNQIQQVMLNLIINARDAMDGKGQITLRLRERPEHDKVMVEVIDNGCGIADRDIKRIFDPFFSTKGERGNGLGLAAVQSILEENRAEIAVQSKVGEGSVFRMFFPAHMAKNDKVQETGLLSRTPGQSST